MEGLFLALLLPVMASAIRCPDMATIQGQLGQQLSSSCSISDTILPRWSEYGAPQPQFVINVSTANDISATVKYCNQQNISFVAQNGGHGWADTFHLGQCGIVINLAGLDNITFNANKTEVIIGGGVSVGALNNAAYNNSARVAAATCSCIGFLGATLGGGLTRVAGLYGMGVDQLLSVDVVMASGDLMRVDSTNEDLFWAIKGAAPNFGIVTSATVKAYPVSSAENTAWQGLVTFADEDLDDFIDAINDLYLDPNMQIDIILSATANGSTSVNAVPFFVGNASAGKAAFQSIFDIGPISDTTGEVSYQNWGAFADYACEDGQRKPTYGISMSNLDPSTWRQVYEGFRAFVAANPDARNSSIIAENYPINSTAVQNGASSFPWRNVKTHVAAYPWYTDAELDSAANAWGLSVRKLLRSSDGLPEHANYVNFAHGDESLQDIYGTSLPRLQSLKKQYDPGNRFNQWFPI
ncbi:Glucooligosaccharide oxidase [Viridothelium virens]|uniref:Glucooligosaccharide oxidase n=1 Tax=Viridothelium virens TaxID=1048519 RepID=A0A6A6GW96_VIRVR|nr:Glucooligosaccharide oxidase [Viridothelium virens]